MTQEQIKNLEIIIDTYGIEPQVDMAIEECSELIKALLKYRRGRNKESSDKDKLREDIVEEIADVKIMLSQMESIYDCSDEVKKQIETKINRQMERIKLKAKTKN